MLVIWSLVMGKIFFPGMFKKIFGVTLQTAFTSDRKKIKRDLAGFREHDIIHRDRKNEY